MKSFYTLIFLFLSISIFSQSSEIWKELISNNRKKALVNVENINSNNLENLLLKQIVNLENGQLKFNQSFIDNFIKYDDFEYYLYAFWNENYFFNEYLETGINLDIKRILKKISTKNIKEPTIKHAIYYLKAISSRNGKNMIAYQKYIDSIPAIKKWQFCGVFENLNQSGLDISYSPEKMAISKSDFNANSNGFINWYSPKRFDTESYQFLQNHDEYGSGVHYAQTFIETKEEQRVFLRLGNASAFKVWLNDILIFENRKDVSTDLDAYTVEITIPKGKNRLLIKNAESGSVSYFIAKLTDELGRVIPSITYQSLYTSYNNSTLLDINPVVALNPIESYFIKKLKKYPDNFLYSYALIRTYLRNSKYDRAKGLLLPLIEKHPKSSFLRKQLIYCYTSEEDFTMVKKIKDNMMLDDENYYISLLYKFLDQKELARLDMNELKKFLDKFSEATDYKILKLSSELIYNSRKSDKKSLKKNLDSLLIVVDGWAHMKRIYASSYSSILNDEKTTLKILEEINNNHFNYSVTKQLALKYEKLNKRGKVIDLYKEIHQAFDKENFSTIDLAKKLLEYEKYKEALIYLNKALDNFPYSFIAMKLKGNALLQLGKKEEAIKWYHKSLVYNSGDSSLRDKVNDLINHKDLIEKIHIKNIYEYIENNRQKNIKNNYGYNILLDDVIVLLYPESGVKSRFTLIYEITSEKGAERFKEYKLNLSGSYKIIKGEIVKPNKSIISADRSGSNFVFKELEIGDVVLFDYQTEYTDTGRFYKDYVDYYQFDSFHPCTKSKYTILVPDNITIKYMVTNGELNFKKEKQENYTKYIWTLNNDLGKPQEESYIPKDVDLMMCLHISTIPSWNKIAFWYSDLVRSQKVFNAEVEKAFSLIFPKGIKNLSENDRASMIYYYMMKTLNYSSVSFRQSGFLPQKPSKTLTTKLGDCKDLSTLFVTLAEKAEIDANLVLVLTNDYGQQSTILPSQDFNHCIVKVRLDNKEQFLELTDKNLPYKSLPKSLTNATALEIPNKLTSKNNFELFKLKDSDGLPSILKRKAKITITNENTFLDIITTMEGAVSSYYIGVFENSNYKAIKRDIRDDFKDNLRGNFVVDTIYNIHARRGMHKIDYSTKIKLNTKPKKMGEITILELPRLSTPYENSIINLDERKYPIEYTQYENVNNYKTDYDIIIPKGRVFVNIPKNQNLSYKKHSYTITYVLIKDNHLKVVTEVKTDISTDISVTNYQEYKNYVKFVLVSLESFIGYK